MTKETPLLSFSTFQLEDIVVPLPSTVVTSTQTQLISPMSRFLSLSILVTLLLLLHSSAAVFPSLSLNATSRMARTASWRVARVSSGSPVVRHEACAVRVRRHVVLLGGRGVNKPVSIYNPQTRVWTRRNGPGPGIEIHHTQCVVVDTQVWIVSSWTGGFPFERNNDKIFIYDFKKDKWSTRPGLPRNRRRGGAAAIRRRNRIYVIGGNRGGHGGHATSLTWVDAYDLKARKWVLNLKPLPAEAARDHVGGALVKGQLCIAGGRNGGVDSFFTQNRAATYCFSLKKNQWRKRADMPSPRAGAMTGRTCDGKMMVAGGEGNGKAYSQVDIFNGRSWTRGPNLTRARHGSGLAVTSCSCRHIFIPSGSGSQGGSPELSSTEQYIPAGARDACTKY